jgi:hypothetical protein
MDRIYPYTPTSPYQNLGRPRLVRRTSYGGRDIAEALRIVRPLNTGQFNKPSSTRRADRERTSGIMDKADIAHSSAVEVRADGGDASVRLPKLTRNGNSIRPESVGSRLLTDYFAKLKAFERFFRLNRSDGLPTDD